jgi:hypothetical protein
MPLYTLRRRHRVVVPDDPTQITPTLNQDPPNPNVQSNRIPAQVTKLSPLPPLWASRYAEVSCAPDPVGAVSGTVLFNVDGSAAVSPRTQSLAGVRQGSMLVADPITGQLVQKNGYSTAQWANQGTFLYFNSPADLLNPARQSMPQSLWPYGTQFSLDGGLTWQQDGAASWFGDDLVLSDVISFNVRVLAVDNNGTYGGQQLAYPLPPADFLDVPVANALYAPVPVAGVNPIYNTGNYSLASPPPYRIQALEISIRVWDVKTQKCRQITIVQDM